MQFQKSFSTVPIGVMIMDRKYEAVKKNHLNDHKVKESISKEYPVNGPYQIFSYYGYF